MSDTDPNPYQPPSRFASSAAGEPREAASPFSEAALTTIERTRWAVWFFIVASALLLVFTLIQVPFGLRFMSRLEDTGNYRWVMIASFLKAPLAALYLWQFYSYERALRRAAAGGSVEALLLAQKRFWTTMVLIVAGYLVVSFSVAGYSSYRVVRDNDRFSAAAFSNSTCTTILRYNELSGS